MIYGLLIGLTIAGIILYFSNMRKPRFCPEATALLIDTMRILGMLLAIPSFSALIGLLIRGA